MSRAPRRGRWGDPDHPHLARSAPRESCLGSSWLLLEPARVAATSFLPEPFFFFHGAHLQASKIRLRLSSRFSRVNGRQGPERPNPGSQLILRGADLILLPAHLRSPPHPKPQADPDCPLRLQRPPFSASRCRPAPFSRTSALLPPWSRRPETLRALPILSHLPGGHSSGSARFRVPDPAGTPTCSGLFPHSRTPPGDSSGALGPPGCGSSHPGRSPPPRPLHPQPRTSGALTRVPTPLPGREPRGCRGRAAGRASPRPGRSGGDAGPPRGRACERREGGGRRRRSEPADPGGGGGGGGTPGGRARAEPRRGCELAGVPASASAGRGPEGRPPRAGWGRGSPAAARAARFPEGCLPPSFPPSGRPAGQTASPLPPLPLRALPRPAAARGAPGAPSRDSPGGRARGRAALPARPAAATRAPARAPPPSRPPAPSSHPTLGRPRHLTPPPSPAARRTPRRGLLLRAPANRSLASPSPPGRRNISPERTPQPSLSLSSPPPTPPARPSPPPASSLGGGGLPPGIAGH